MSGWDPKWDRTLSEEWFSPKAWWMAIAAFFAFMAALLVFTLAVPEDDPEPTIPTSVYVHPEVTP